jgi:integrase
MINRIFKPKGSRIWRWRFRLHSEDGRIEDVSLGTSDKQVAEKRRGEMLREREHERAGFIPPKAVRYSAQRSLAEHLVDFVGDMRRRGKSDKYLANIQFRVGALIAACRWSLPKDVTADTFQQWRQEHQDLAAKTVNDYLEAARCLFNWMVKNGRVVANPLVTVEKVSMVGTDTRERRAMTDDEVRALLAVSGERNAVYLMAVHTGLRRSEIAALKWSDLTLDAVTPFVQVRASTTKNGKSAAMRLHPDLLAALLEHKAKAAGDCDLVFPRMPRIERFCRDLKKAGVPYKDAQGRYADFHSLRKTFGTNLQKAGVPSRVAMKAMRHSDRRLTDKIYTDENMLDTWSAIGGLPSFTEQASLIASQILVAAGQNVSLPVTTSVGPEIAKTIVNIGDCHGLAQGVTTGHDAGNGGSGGARTRNLCRDRAAL